jgi:hypothetical protein
MSLFSVGRAECTYVVPRDHPAPDDVRHRIDGVFRDHVPASCARAIHALAPEHDPSIVLIDRVDVELAVFDAIESDRLAALWSAEIARAIARLVRRGEGVLRFAGRAAFVAQYVADVAAGRDGGAWYYALFASLRSLPAAMRIREAIVREPEHAFAIVAELVRLERDRDVITALGHRGADEVWETAFPSGECRPSPRLLELAASFWEAEEMTTTRGALRVAAALLRYGIEETPETPAAIRAHVDALRVLAMAARDWRVVESILSGDVAAALRAIPADSLAAAVPVRLLAAIAETRPDTVTCAASTVATSTPASDTLLGSAFAGYAMLLPILAEFELDSGARERVLASCAASKELLFDPVVQLVRGEDESPARARTSRIAKRVLANFAARIPGFARSTPAHLRENFLDGPGALRIDRERIEVFLPRMPLAVLLRMMGMHGKTFELPWLPDRTITLLLPEDA